MTGKSDEALDRLLKGAMRRDAQAADACPDAEMLAAFAEGAVSAQERTRVERHVSDCGRCAQTLALLAETADVSATTAAAGRASSNWFSWGAWRWLVPAATAAAVLAIWFALPHGNPEGPRSDGQVALQEPPEVTPGSVEPPTPPSALVSPPTETSVPQQQPQRSAVPLTSSVSDALSKTSRADASADAAAAPVAEAKKAAGSTESAEKQAAAPAALAAPAAPPALASSEAAVAPAGELRQQQRESTSTVRDANEAKEERAEAVADPPKVALQRLGQAVALRQVGEAAGVEAGAQGVGRRSRRPPNR